MWFPIGFARRRDHSKHKAARRKTVPVRLDLELLEARLTPSVSWSVSTTGLNITGTAGNDNAVLIDDGSRLTLDADGPGPVAAVSVPNKLNVFVNLGSGDDTFLYRHRMSLGDFAFDRNVYISGEDGHDVVMVDNIKNPATGARADFQGGRHNFSVDGGNNNDMIWVDIDQSRTLELALPHSRTQELSINPRGDSFPTHGAFPPAAPFHEVIGGNIIDGARVSFDLQGGMGSDSLLAGTKGKAPTVTLANALANPDSTANLVAQALQLKPITSDVAAGSILSITMNGDPPFSPGELPAATDFGRDSLFAAYSGQAAGAVNIFLDGGLNNDTLKAVVTALAGSGSASDISGITVYMRGGEGTAGGLFGLSGDILVYEQYDLTDSADHIRATLTGEGSFGAASDFDVLYIHTEGGLAPDGIHNGQVSTLDQAFDQVVYV
jgi:hypothetical protein